MDFLEATKKAINEDRCIALPWDSDCEGDGHYLIKLKPYPEYFKPLEFNGRKTMLKKFPTRPKYILKTNWFVVD